MLHRLGIVDLTQSICAEPARYSDEQHLRDAALAILVVELEGGCKIVYDTHDSWEVNQELLASSKLYFKRSYQPQLLRENVTEHHKVRPLGLNYLVYPATFDSNDMWRNLRISKGKSKLQMLRSINAMNKIKFTPNTENMWALPDSKIEPKVLFMVRAFDPYNSADRNQDKMDQRNEINESRADCIRLLKKEFGDRFFGGFMHNNYAQENYSGQLMPQANIASKKNYIKLLKQYPICVSTTGLHNSIGWKFSEYIAFSKAIICEELRYQVPGSLTKDKHYLEFSCAEQCVEHAVSLVDDKLKRTQMMKDNMQYYQQSLRPDMLILNTLIEALQS